jgi:hypothetical protein
MVDLSKRFIENNIDKVGIALLINFIRIIGATCGPEETSFILTSELTFRNRIAPYIPRLIRHVKTDPTKKEVIVLLVTLFRLECSIVDIPEDTINTNTLCALYRYAQELIHIDTCKNRRKKIHDIKVDLYSRMMQDEFTTEQISYATGEKVYEVRQFIERNHIDVDISVYLLWLTDADKEIIYASRQIIPIDVFTELDEVLRSTPTLIHDIPDPLRAYTPYKIPKTSIQNIRRLPGFVTNKNYEFV